MRHYVFKGIILYLIMGLGLHLGCVSSDKEAPLPSPVAQANEISDAGFSQNDSGILAIDSGTQTSVVPSESDSGTQDRLPVDGGSVVNTPFTDAGYPETILDSGGAVWHDAGIQTALQTDSGVMVAEDFLPLTDTSCSALCLSRSENTNGYGGCEFSWLSGNCETRCLDMNVFSTQTQAAFATCTLYDPLCYLDIEQCVWGQRYPWPETTTITTIFSGTGFSDFNGHTVRIAIDGSPETYSYAPNQVVTNGDRGDLGYRLESKRFQSFYVLH